MFSFGDVSVPNLYIMGSFHLVVNYWTSLVPLASVSQLLTLFSREARTFLALLPGRGQGLGWCWGRWMLQQHYWSSNTAHRAAQLSGVWSWTLLMLPTKGFGSRVGKIFFLGSLTQDADFLAWTFFLLPAREIPAGSFCVRDGQWGGSGVQSRRCRLWELKRQLCPLSQKLNECFSIFQNQRTNKPFWSEQSSQGASCACGQALTQVPANCVGWCVCVFWFSFLIIFLQSVHGPPSGVLWIACCPWAPRSSAGWMTLISSHGLHWRHYRWRIYVLLHIFTEIIACLEYFDTDKWLK